VLGRQILKSFRSPDLSRPGRLDRNKRSQRYANGAYE